jgi:hypothetical protein
MTAVGYQVSQLVYHNDANLQSLLDLALMQAEFNVDGAHLQPVQSFHTNHMQALKQLRFVADRTIESYQAGVIDDNNFERFIRQSIQGLRDVAYALEDAEVGVHHIDVTLAELYAHGIGALDDILEAEALPTPDFCNVVKQNLREYFTGIDDQYKRLFGHNFPSMTDTRKKVA